MITSLHIRNIGIIDDLSIDFEKGFNVLTGETGAGKTLIIDSLQILAGGRFSKEMIRSGQDFSFVEMSLHLKEQEEDIVVSREININGKNVCKINGRMATVNELKEYMKDIIDIHGQHDNQSILEQQMHLYYLDCFAGKELLELKRKYQEKYKQWSDWKLELQNNYGDEKEKQRRLDLLKYELNEIEAAKLKNGEEEELEAQRKVLLNAEAIRENLASASYQLSEIAMDAINTARKNLEKIEDLDASYKACLESIQEIYYNLEETARDVADSQDTVEFDESTRQMVEERLDLIFSLKRKYGNSIQEILDYGLEVKKEIETIENLEEYNTKLREKIENIEKEMSCLAEKMHDIRASFGEVLNEKITQELVDLEMKNAKFKVQIEGLEQEAYTKNGLDRVEFLIQTNIGDEYKPLIKIASGGEMSRIMLGIKKVLADVDQVPVLVFDEIDTGISGMAANKVAEKLKWISKTHQVLCITHLAVIAAKGDANYYIHKEVVEGQTKTRVQKLKENEIIREIARIASGEINEVSLEHARVLRNK